MERHLESYLKWLILFSPQYKGYHIKLSSGLMDLRSTLFLSRQTTVHSYFLDTLYIKFVHPLTSGLRISNYVLRIERKRNVGLSRLLRFCTSLLILGTGKTHRQ